MNISASGVYYSTSSSSANVLVGSSSGWFYRSTSATKYKENIEYNITDDYAENILSLNPASWHDKAEDQKIANAIETGDYDEQMPSYLQRYYGLIAEDLENAGLSNYVTYGDPDSQGNREPEGIQYDRLWTLLIPVIRNMKNNYETRISELETDKDYLLSKISGIESKLINNGSV